MIATFKNALDSYYNNPFSNEFDSVINFLKNEGLDVICEFHKKIHRDKSKKRREVKDIPYLFSHPYLYNQNYLDNEWASLLDIITTELV